MISRPKQLLVVLLGVFVLSSAVYAAGTGGDVLMDYLMRTAMIIPDEFTVSLSQEFRYNDNTDERWRSKASKSWISETTGGLRLTRTASHITYGVDASVSNEHYFHKRENDDSSDWSYTISPVLLGDLACGLLNGKIMVSAKSAHTREEVDDSSNKTTSVFRNELKIAWDQVITGKISVITTGTLMSERYMDKEFKDLENKKYGLSVSPTYRYSKRTRYGLTFGDTRTKYREHDGHDDYDDVKIGAFVEHIFTERTAGWLESGATRTFYDNNSVSDNSNHANDWEWYIRSRIAYQLLKDVALGFSLSRDVEDSISGDARGNRMVYEAATSVTWKLTGKLTFIQKLAFTRKDEKTCDDDNDRVEYDISFQYKGPYGIDYYTGWNVKNCDYKYKPKRDYLENEWRIGMKVSF